jgi:hypothetical protein
LDATIPEALMPKLSATLSHDQWSAKQSYTAPVTKAGIIYRVTVNWTKQSLWIYGGSRVSIGHSTHGEVWTRRGKLRLVHSQMPSTSTNLQES